MYSHVLLRRCFYQLLSPLALTLFPTISFSLFIHPIAQMLSTIRTRALLLLSVTIAVAAQTGKDGTYTHPLLFNVNDTRLSHKYHVLIALAEDYKVTAVPGVDSAIALNFSQYAG